MPKNRNLGTTLKVVLKAPSLQKPHIPRVLVMAFALKEFFGAKKLMCLRFISEVMFGLVKKGINQKRFSNMIMKMSLPKCAVLNFL
jgi:hypothetical protein